MTPEQRSQVEERFTIGDPAVYAAAEFRLYESDLVTLAQLGTIKDPSFIPYRSYYLIPKLNEMKGYFSHLFVEHSLKIGQRGGEGIVANKEKYSPQLHNLELYEGEDEPAEGELVVVENSSISQYIPKVGIVPIFEAIVRPLEDSEYRNEK
jgi:hypothetical protein